MTTTYTPPRLILGQWLIDEQTWIGDWLLVEVRHWFPNEPQAWTIYNDIEWTALENRLLAQAYTGKPWFDKNESVNV